MTTTRKTKMAARRLAGLALAATFIVAGPAIADDAADRLEQDAKAQIAYFNKNRKRVKSAKTYAQLIMEMSSVQHPLVAKRVGKALLKEKDLERRMIASAALGTFVHTDEAREAAGIALVDGITKTKKIEDELLENCTHSLGKLEYTPAVPLMSDLIKTPSKIDPWVMVTTVRALAKCDDWRALPVLLKLWEFTAKGFSWETGEVTVDTGSSGDADQKAAEAAWNAKYGMVKKQGKPPLDLRVYAEEVAKAASKICSDKDNVERFSNAAELRKWMVDRVEKLTAMGIEIPPLPARLKRQQAKAEKAAKNK